MSILKATGSRKDLMQTDFYEQIEDLLHTPEIQQLKQYRHHIRTNRFQHCLNVAYYQYKLCKLLKLDAKSAARAGLLHDLYFYETKDYTRQKPAVRHSKHHPQIALQNAEQLLNLNDKERDMIVKHMWPVTTELPKYTETYLLTIVDKYCAVIEFLLPQPKTQEHQLQYLPETISNTTT